MTKGESTKKTLKKSEALDVFRLCFEKTNKEYLSYGDFHFLLHEKARIGKTAPREKKELYKKWKQEFKKTFLDGRQHPLAWEDPFRRYVFDSSWFKKITDSLIKENKLKKVKMEKNKTYYTLVEKTDLRYSFKMRQKRKLSNFPPFSHCHTGGKYSIIDFYGIPTAYPPSFHTSWNKVLLDFKLRDKIDKLGSKLDKRVKEFFKISRNIRSLIIEELVEEIDKNNYDKLDKKLAFLYLKAYLSGEEDKDFKWTTDKNRLEFLPKNHLLGNEISEILLYFIDISLCYEYMIVIDISPPPVDYILKEKEDLVNIRKKIEDLVENQ